MDRLLAKDCMAWRWNSPKPSRIESGTGSLKLRRGSEEEGALPGSGFQRRASRRGSALGVPPSLLVVPAQLKRGGGRS